MADKDDAIAFALMKYNHNQGTAINQLRILQREVIEKVLTNHTIAMLPTGYGKSLCYEIHPDVIEYLLEKPAFVIVPLNVILSQQKEKMGRRATCLNKEHDRELTAKSAEQTRWTEGQYQFVGSQDWVGRSYELAERMLGDKMYSGGLELKHTRVVQFHASMEKTGDKESYMQIKSIILQNLAEDPANSPLTIVFATIALGMGADLRHVRKVINIGPPKKV
ncbi:uncharacterized protein LOC124270684 [Haliotis rubra]|uniref:uncharacterized protein LOC124270684 n=1 Tax=Haliotis rubra TaxID=36100 RepID=UPI001EE5E226|nr:uncharacterized protein LOC124270684 [Haliotis rubra]